ncbi:MAG TPA: 2-oxoglutarate and iron-dependent oxygenase domain-containing protein [Actinophytocola sp.]|uniref:isopenicillin N synthase family dioxygenase n=1 Tax=Actinophytocola sp. TaxID=1872138 RepID=UPI002DDDA3CA|nr:2-oxoglutarate and iron-dependent oxygenase domain-containing protein [Actinophytocola sp.]HEV2779842.1 2-oxoglutarate and iron-dependent oxygenase domain-containing protein [Actinophytocola sp.]
MPALPVIDISPLVDRSPDRHAVAAEIGRACREDGFFYVVGHGVSESLQARLEELSREFFAQDLERKLEIHMSRGGRAWRGYFPVGDELTSGRPDLKEGLYFGAELPADHPAVRAGTPLHGPNLFPAHPAGLRRAVLDYLAALTTLGHTLMSGIALSLDLDEHYFADRYTADPLILFRIFNYPAVPAADGSWGVGEHTDYGLLTILRQDGTGGLQVRSHSGWLDATPIPGSFVCNIGDMLDRLTGGRYRSTPHRVLPSTTRDRLSWPFFFDPAFTADVTPVAHRALADPHTGRWDNASPHDFHGTYGDYLLAKIGKVFPDLSRDVL